MEINVSELLKETGRKITLNEPINIAFQKDELEIEGSINANLELINAGGNILAKGSLNANIALICARCLKKYFNNLNINIEEEFSKETNDLSFPIEPDNSIELDEMIRQNILTEIPIKSVCGEGCRI